jgi:hypothetical protein
MQYKFDIEISATINDTVAMDMVIAAVERQTGKTIASINPSYDGTRFNGFQITFDSVAKPKVVPFKPSKEFIVTNFDDN